MSKKKFKPQFTEPELFIARFRDSKTGKAVKLVKDKKDDLVFKSKPEANKYINSTKKFCPLICGKCRHDCVCYTGNTINKIRGNFRVILGECTNLLYKKMD